jgi:hypothetical protein
MARDFVLQYAAERKIEGDLLLRLQNLDEEELGPAVELIRALHPSANTLRELLRLADEISVRDEIRWTEVFKREAANCILSDERLNRKDKYQRLRAQLEEWRYPVLSGIKAKLREVEAEIVRKFGVNVDLPVDLEGDELKVLIEFRSCQELLDVAKRLESVAGSEELREVFALLKGSTEKGDSSV